MHQGVRLDQAYLGLGIGQRHVLHLKAQPFSARPQQRPEDLWADAAIRYLQHQGVRIGELQPLDMRCPLIVLRQQIEIGGGAQVDEARREMAGRHIALDPLVICQVS